MTKVNRSAGKTEEIAGLDAMLRRLMLDIAEQTGLNYGDLRIDPTQPTAHTFYGVDMRRALAAAIAPALASKAKVDRPANCRNRLRDEGKPYPKSGCFSCRVGGLRGCPYERGSAQEPPSTIRDDAGLREWGFGPLLDRKP